VVVEHHHEVIDWTKGSRFIVLVTQCRDDQGNPMRGKFKGISSIVEKYEDVRVIHPVLLKPKFRNHECLSSAER